jgi:hypothetical protein
VPGQRDGDSGERPKTHDAVSLTGIDVLSESWQKTLTAMLPARSGSCFVRLADRFGSKVI